MLNFLIAIVWTPIVLMIFIIECIIDTVVWFYKLMKEKINNVR